MTQDVHAKSIRNGLHGRADYSHAKSGSYKTWHIGFAAKHRQDYWQDVG